ncbi:hypothetical protein [Bacillus piscicola]|uniref:hypothetical protein n=1 Tax=Bacillus piscicola TaxID=1632684 RepID=UPI001F08C005|nr:hypothetical protein [Bacillus piscicola]
MLIVGFGKLAVMVTELNKRPDVFHVFNRTASKLIEKQKTNPRLRYVDSSFFPQTKRVFLALPPEGVLGFLKHYRDYFPTGSWFYHTATNVTCEELEQIAPHYHFIPAKFAGHALQAVREKSGGTFVIPEKFRSEAEELQGWLGDRFQVMRGSEEEVKTANRIAVEETIRMAVKLTNRLDQEGVPPSIQKAVMGQIPGGVLHAHLEGQHGGFAKSVLKKQKELENDEDR